MNHVFSNPVCSLQISLNSLLGFPGGGSGLVFLTRTGGLPPSLVSDEGGLNAVMRWILLALGGLGFLLLVSGARCSSESPAIGYGGLPPAWSVVGTDLAGRSGGWAEGESCCPPVSAGIRSGAIFDVWRWRVRRPGDDGGVIGRDAGRSTSGSSGGAVNLGRVWAPGCDAYSGCYGGGIGLLDAMGIGQQIRGALAIGFAGGAEAAGGVAVVSIKAFNLGVGMNKTTAIVPPSVGKEHMSSGKDPALEERTLMSALA